MASAEDMLFPHLDRLPPLREGQSIARLAYDPVAKYLSIADLAAGLPGTSVAPPPPAASALAGADPALGFVDTPDGQVFVRAYGDTGAPRVVLLHDCPGTGLRLEAVARALATEAYVVAPDLPGCGQSDAPPEDRPILDVCGVAVEAVAAALGLERFVLGAGGVGAAVAAEVAGRPHRRATAVVLDGVSAPLQDGEADAIAPDLPLSPEGAHWLKAWLMVRDGEIYRPWFDGRVAAQRRTQGNFDADWLHDQTVSLMNSRATYHRLARAAARVDARALLAGTPRPVIIAREGEFGQAIGAALRGRATSSYSLEPRSS
jgi:pimeloyl-ACP methyl ester carboxylesterase